MIEQLPGQVAYAPEEMKCEVCDKSFSEGDEVLTLTNTETREVTLIHRSCLDRVGTS